MFFVFGFIKAFFFLKNVVDCFAEEFFDRLSVYSTILEKLNAFSKSVQSSSVPTLSSIPHLVWAGQVFLRENGTDGSVASVLKKCLLKSFNTRLSGYVEIICKDGEAEIVPNALKAAFLDPRFSKEVQKRFDGKVLECLKGAIIADTLLLVDESHVSLVEAQLPGALNHVAKLMSELKDPESVDCLRFWKDLSVSKQSSLLSSVFLSARLYLSMPSGGSPSECVFSSTTDLVTKKRNSLDDRTVEKVVIVRAYARSPLYSLESVVADLAKDVAEKKKKKDDEEVKVND